MKRTTLDDQELFGAPNRAELRGKIWYQDITVIESK